ncbi:MAG: hypothetical protein Q8K60_02885 [Parachlamydiaceae bacterium]|nr:hypothetical protein [Parachlamydiaceae bacterium]
MSHKYEKYLKEKPPKEKPKKIPPTIEKVIEEQKYEEHEHTDMLESRGKMALRRLTHLSDMVIYSEIIGKPKGFEY